MLWLGWQITAAPVSVSVDGIADRVYTHRRTVGALMVDLGLGASPQDIVQPARETAIRRGRAAPQNGSQAITVERARPIRLLVDGQDLRIATQGDTPLAVLTAAGFLVDRYDEVLVNGERAMWEAPLPVAKTEFPAPTYDRGYAWERLTVEPMQIRLRRAIPFTVDDGEAPYEVRTTAQTVGEALRQAQVTLYLGDRVQPPLGSSVSTSLRVTIQRSTPLSLRIGSTSAAGAGDSTANAGILHKTRTRAKTVGDALSELGVVIAGLDRVEPPLSTPLYPDIRVTVTRVTEDVVIKEEIEPYETVFVPDPNLPIDTQQVVNAGAEGITRRRYRVRYENGVEQARNLEDTWLAQKPTQRQIAYGQRIDPQTFTGPDGTTITYWRKIKMLATSYNAASAGGSRTFTGDALRGGIVAIDPRLVPLRSKVYVPGYGYGDALDTGGAIRSRRIDLAYDDANFVSILRWVDVYLLWPPPAANQITWVVPNFPRPPGE